jgi:hypothetical protein
MIEKRTPYQIERLKEDWETNYIDDFSPDFFKNDTNPIDRDSDCYGDGYDFIENTKGFEAHRIELFAFRVECEKKWADERKAKIQERTMKLGLPIDAVKYLESLEQRIEKLEKINKFKDKHTLI